jgi:hypothetical protein
MKASYLIINGKKATIGQKYWEVSMVRDFKIKKCIAGKENNVATSCYFDNEAEAELYKQMAEMLLFLAPRVRKIEQEHQGDGFRSKVNGYNK